MISIQSILCPTDLTSEADEALRYGVALALSFEAKLFVLTCADDYGALRGLEREQTCENIKQCVERVVGMYADADICKLNWQSIVSDRLHLAAAITTAASERAADLIVMRSRRRPLAATLLGSTAEAVCRTAPCPVLVTHPKEREWVGYSTGKIDLERVLVAQDFSDYAELALHYAVSFAQEYQS